MTSEDTDELRAARAADGDRESFELLMRTHVSAVRRTIRLHGVPSSETEDLTQRAFVSVWRALADYDPGRPFRPWLYRIVLNVVRDWRRYRRVRAFFFAAPSLDDADVGPIAEQGPGVERTVHAQQVLESLRTVLTSLPQDLKAPLLLTAISGLSYAEAASSLGITVKALEGRIARARIRLEAAIGERLADLTPG